jgi:hypothetical protein
MRVNLKVMNYFEFRLVKLDLHPLLSLDSFLQYNKLNALRKAGASFR